jgi:hypothetical protein
MPLSTPTTGALTIDGVVHRAGMGGYSPKYKITHIEAWSLSVQQQLKGNLILEVNYSASAARHLLVFDSDVNRFAGDLIQNDNTLTRLNPYLAGTEYATSDGNSIGNYGSVSAIRRLTHGLTLRGIYTYGRTLDVISNSVSLDSGSITTTTNVIQSEAPANKLVSQNETSSLSRLRHTGAAGSQDCCLRTEASETSECAEENSAGWNPWCHNSARCQHNVGLRTQILLLLAQLAASRSKPPERMSFPPQSATALSRESEIDASTALREKETLLLESSIPLESRSLGSR